MKDRWLYLSSLSVAGVCGVLIPVCTLSTSAHRLLVRPCIIVAAATAATLLVRILLDPKCRRGINIVNRDLQGGRAIGFRSIRLSDGEWGLFGKRTGSPTLFLVRATLFVEFCVAMLVSGSRGNDLLVLAFAAFSIAILLSIIHIGLSTVVAQHPLSSE